MFIIVKTSQLAAMQRPVLLSLLLILFALPSSYAGHYITGYFEWEALGNDSFKVTLNVYQDCNSTIPPTAPKFNIESPISNYQVSSSKVGSTEDITPLCRNSCTRCSSSSCGLQYGTKKASFSAIIDLSNERKKSRCNVIAYVKECCRPSGLTGGSSEAWHIQAEINACMVPNSSPTWSDNGPSLMCSGSNQKIDCSITTGNPKDSVIYSLTTPLVTATKMITWNSGYGAEKPLNFLGFPRNTLSYPRGFHLDSLTGMLGFRPMGEHAAVMAVTAEIYRGGKFVGSVSRESQVLVIKCPSNAQPLLSGVNCKKSSVTNLEMKVCPGTKVCFKVCTSDSDKDDTLYLDWNKGIPGGTFKTLDPKSKRPTGEFCWTPTAADISTVPHKMVVTVYDDACPVNGVASQLYSITVKRPDSAQVSLHTTDLGCNKYRFRLKSVNNVVPNSVSWFINDSIPIGLGDSIEHEFDSIGTFVVAGVSDGCYQQILKDTIEVKTLGQIEILGIDSSSYLCASQTLKLTPAIQGAVGQPQFSWKIDSKVKSHSSLTADSMEVNFHSVGVAPKLSYAFELSIVDSLKCTLTKEFEVVTVSPDTVNVEGDYSLCEGTQSTLTLKPYNGSGSWTGPAIINNQMDLGSLSPGQYTARFAHADSNGCFVDSSIITLKPTPQADAGSDFTTCTSALPVSLLGKPTGGIWSGSGINSNNELEPNTLKKGQYTLRYVYTNSSGCTDVDSALIDVVDHQLLVTAPDSAFSCDDGASFVLTGKPEGGFWAGAGYASSGETVVIDPKAGIPGRQNLVYTVTDTNQCSGRDTTLLVIDNLPWASFTVVDSVVKQGDTLPVQNNSQLSTTHGAFTWIVSGPTSKIGKGVSPKLKMDSLGYHDVGLVVKDTLTGCSDTFEMAMAVRVVLATSLGLDNFKMVEVYPNPTSDQLNIVNAGNEPLTISMFSISGKLLYRAEGVRGKETIDLAHLPSGVYTLELTDAGATNMRKVIKE